MVNDFTITLKRFHYLHSFGCLGMTIVITERLDRLYVCKQCKACFLFKSDVEDHMMHMPKHQDFVTRPLE